MDPSTYVDLTQVDSAPWLSMEKLDNSCDFNININDFKI